MEYVTLNNGIKMPMAGIGTFLLTPDEAEASVLNALACGYRLIDTASYTAAGGISTVVHLPDEGITGNDHFMFQDMNNDVIAEHIENWIQANVMSAE